jgi:phosphoethanolamine N-methyltransferase
MQSFTDMNKEVNGSQYQNTSFICADVTTLEFPDNSFDFIFSNWLFMYLTDSEVEGSSAELD